VVAAGQAEAVRCAPCGFCRVFGGNSLLRWWRAVEVFGLLSIIYRRRRGACPRTAIAYSRDRSASRPGETSGPKHGFYHRIRSMSHDCYLLLILRFYLYISVDVSAIRYTAIDILVGPVGQISFKCASVRFNELFNVFNT
jgi:hypothetical protein